MSDQHDEGEPQNCLLDYLYVYYVQTLGFVRNQTWSEVLLQETGRMAQQMSKPAPLSFERGNDKK